MSSDSIPIVDIFAGPGGLSEGFSSIFHHGRTRAFNVCVSIEKNAFACETLKLRAFFRRFPSNEVPDKYYDYIAGKTPRQTFMESEEWRRAEDEIHCATLGETPAEYVDQWISNAIGDSDPWVLIGGPPCQAYSVVGRSRMRNSDPVGFEQDKRHFLYKEYLRIIQKFRPAVFVMENVKGMLSSTHGGSLIFEKIREDLSEPCAGLSYQIRSFVTDVSNLKPADFIIEAEHYGIPQRRHRVILLGVRSDLQSTAHGLLSPYPRMVSVGEALSGMSRVRSRLSRESDSFDNWISALSEAPRLLKNWDSGMSSEVRDLMNEAIQQAAHIGDNSDISSKQNMPKKLSDQLLDTRMPALFQHEPRSHMREDLHRYLFASCYAEIAGISPKLDKYPTELWPLHKNLNAHEVPFDDRFRVQCLKLPSTTVVSHIAKDGHYYIHPDPAQCRSLTVREAARLQTFPDNYFFEGPRTHQYTQVGNAVPPLLAQQLASTVLKLIRG